MAPPWRRVLVAPVVPLPYSDAAAVDPEEAYIAALASCHMLWFLDFASRAGWRRQPLHRRGHGHHGQERRPPGGQPCAVAPVTVFDAAHAPTAAVLADLHHQAHAACFLANSVKTQIDCAPVWKRKGLTWPTPTASFR